MKSERKGFPDSLSGAGQTPSVEELEANAKRVRREKELEKQRKERELNQAVNTIALRAIGELSDGNDLPQYVSEHEEFTLPGDPELGSEGVLYKAVRICMQAGLSAEEVAKRFSNGDTRFKSKKELETRGPSLVRENITNFSIPISEIFKDAMGH
jgi:hypothetical protein